jgi:hypothetical protein
MNSMKEKPMNHDHHSHESHASHESHGPHDAQPPNFWRSRYAIGLAVLGGIAAYFLLTEHLAHVVGALPLLILLACPLMHLFMHHDHGGHQHHQNDAKAPTPSAATTTPRKSGEPS